MIENKSSNQESRHQRGLIAVQQVIQRGESLQYNMEEIELDTDGNMSALFQNSDDSSVETEQDVVQVPVQVDRRGAPQLAPQDARRWVISKGTSWRRKDT